MLQRLLLVSCVAVAPALAQADTAVFASVGTRSGGEVESNAPTTPGCTSSCTYDTVSLGSGTSAALTVSISKLPDLDPDTAVELYLSQSKHSLDPLDSGEMTVSYAMIGGVKYFPTAGTSILPYFGGVIGGSQVKLPQTSDKLYPAIGFYGGAELPIGKHLAARLEARWNGVIVTSESGVLCVNGACAARLQGGVVSQWEGNIGLGLRF